VNSERAAGLESGYLFGPHWLRIKQLSYLLAGGRCEGWGCEKQHSLQRHHHHYESVGWESLFAVSVVCDECHRRVTYEWPFQQEIDDRRANEIEERNRALASLGEPAPADGVYREWPSAG
jgi:hypothetical protein